MAALLATACSGPGAGGAMGAGADAGTDASAPAGAMVSVRGHVNGGLASGGMDEPVTVCVHGRDDLPCVETDPLGQYTLELPAHSEVALTFRHPLLTPTVRAFLTTDEPLELGNTRVANVAGLASVAEASGYPNDAAKGAIFFSGIEGVTANLVAPAGGDLLYLDLRGTLAADAVELPFNGTGVYMNVEPGETRLQFFHPQGDCSFRRDNTLSGWPDTGEANIARIPVLAGSHTHTVSMFCGQP